MAGIDQLLADRDDLVLHVRRQLTWDPFGRRDRGTSPASPSARNRCTSVITHRRDTLYSRATSLLDRPSITTAATTSRAIDISHSLTRGVHDVSRQV